MEKIESLIDETNAHEYDDPNILTEDEMACFRMTDADNIPVFGESIEDLVVSIIGQKALSKSALENHQVTVGDRFVITVVKMKKTDMENMKEWNG